MNHRPDRDFARQLDAEDPLHAFRQLFHIPVSQDGTEQVYLCGNSLGLMPRAVREAVVTELDEWAKWGVEGHFHSQNPWFGYHRLLTQQAAALVGALPEEVVVMNNLTVNLHLMLASFYRPLGRRNKILMEGGAFPSDQYALESQARWHSLHPEEVIVELFPRPGEDTLRTEDILARIGELGDELALVMMGGVNYYTGQFYPLAEITAAAHAVGATVGFDLAHAAGNVPLELHEWSVDFAVWCSYKYLNSGPGGTSGVFVHQRHADRPELVRLAGWWGHDEATRFQMKKGFRPMYGAEGWQTSNAQILPMAAHRASLDLFAKAGGMKALRTKSLRLTAYLEYLITQSGAPLRIITPADPQARGCQLSIVAQNGKAIFEQLTAAGIVADWREPDVIRMAPVPLYNGFEELLRVYDVLTQYRTV